MIMEEEWWQPIRMTQYELEKLHQLINPSG